MRDSRRAFLSALQRVEPRLARAFEEAILDVRSAAQRRVIQGAIERAIRDRNIARGVQEVTAALQLGPEFFAPLDRGLLEAFEAGVAYQQEVVPARPFAGATARRLLVRFDYRHPEAERFTRNQSGALITEIANDTREMIRQTIQDAVEAQQPYQTVTRALIGSTEGNRLTGGLIGLHSTQAAAVRRARDQLEALDPAYFSRQRRDRRFDGLVRRAIRDGQPLSRADIGRITGRYADRLLRLRGETIARTEGNKAMQQGRNQQIAQMIERGDIPATAVTKIWDATPDSRTRDHHLLNNGQSRKWGEAWVSTETGYPMQHPHDENAPGADVISCRCTMRARIDWAQVAR